MKAQKKLNVVLIVLIIILISIVSFVGVYHLEKNQMVSILPDYVLGTNISGYRKVTLEISEESDESNSETVTTNEESTNDISENSIEENVVEETNLKEENSKKYRDSAKILKNRLKSLKVDDFNISCDESTGKIEITLPENDQTDTILSDIVQKGNFEITDTNTGNVLITNDDVKSVDVSVVDNYGYQIVLMSINFKLSGANKLKNISLDYNENAVIETENNTTDEISNEISNDVLNDESNETSNETSNEISDETSSEENETEEVSKTVDLKIDDSTLLTTGFSKIIDNGVLQLTIGSSTDEEEIKESLYGGYNVASIIENDPLPVDYEVTENIYLQGSFELVNINIIVVVLIIIALIISIFMIIKFKMKGFLSTILSIGYLAILLIIIRFANVTLSLDGVLAIGLAFIINSVFNYILLNNLKNKNLSKEERIKKYYDAVKKYSIILIPLVILSIICCFINWDKIYSFGMIVFWAIIISVLYNLSVTNLLVRNK